MVGEVRGCKQGRGEGAWGEVRCNLHLLYIRRACCCAAASTAAARCTARSAALVAPWGVRVRVLGLGLG